MGCGSWWGEHWHMRQGWDRAADELWWMCDRKLLENTPQCWASKEWSVCDQVFIAFLRIVFHTHCFFSVWKGSSNTLFSVYRIDVVPQGVRHPKMLSSKVQKKLVRTPYWTRISYGRQPRGNFLLNTYACLILMLGVLCTIYVLPILGQNQNKWKEQNVFDMYAEWDDREK